MANQRQRRAVVVAAAADAENVSEFILLGLKSQTFTEISAKVLAGFPFQTVRRFQRTCGLSLRQVAEIIGTPERTLLRRRQTGRLAPDESDRLLRAARIFAHAVRLFEGEADDAREWLARPQPALGGISGLTAARTDTGARELEQLMGRLEHGIPS